MAGFIELLSREGSANARPFSAAMVDAAFDMTLISARRTALFHMMDNTLPAAPETARIKYEGQFL